MYRKVLVELIVYAVVFIIVILLCTLPNIIGEYQYAKFRKMLKAKKITEADILSSIKQEINQLPGVSNIEVITRKNYKYNCFSNSNIIGISSQWLYDYVIEGHSSLRTFEELFFTICHELGHNYYQDDGLVFTITPSQILKARMKEIRADLYAKTKAGLNDNEVSRVMTKKIRRTKVKKGLCFYSDHPSWNMRIYCVRNFSSYEENEIAIRNICKNKLIISKRKLDRISLQK